MLFPVTAALFAVPFMIVQYRRHGYIHKVRAIVLYLLLLYLMNAFFLILLPLPKSIHNEPPQAGSYFQLVPFRFVSDILRETAVKADAPSTYWHLLKERAVWQVAFNVVLTVPFGMFLRYYFRANWLRCLLLSLGLSLLFETTQVTGIFGIYDYPYRLFDVDDLLTNTAGGMVGFLVAEWVASHLPRIDKLDENVDLTQQRVSYTRRGLAFLIDWIVMAPAMGILRVFDVPYPYVAAVLIYFVGLPFFTNGRTIGKWAVRIRLKGRGERIRLDELLIRYGLLYLVVFGLNLLDAAYLANHGSKIVAALGALALLVMDAAFGLHLISRMITRKRQLFYEERSGTGHVIA
ncbi:VanZ family protein [Cohnella sp. CBP 2801]|uniref:VanZ family protein n=2 Tax=Cohnella zeiphila TaxID=2761120 RepID=A0A7X0SRF2_9BACL|nr:VanZ family protein [Cohnella zeiphila]